MRRRPSSTCQPWAGGQREQDVELIYRQMGRKGLEGIENVGPRLALVVESLAEKYKGPDEMG